MGQLIEDDIVRRGTRRKARRQQGRALSTNAQDTEHTETFATVLTHAFLLQPADH